MNRPSLSEAIRAYEAGDIGQTLRLCASILEQHPTDDAVLNLMGVAEMRRGDFSAACRVFSRAVEINPANADYRSNLLTGRVKRAESLLMAADWQNAVDAFNDVLRMDHVSAKTSALAQERLVDANLVLRLRAQEPLRGECGTLPASPELIEGVRAQLDEKIIGPVVIFYHVGGYEIHPMAGLTGKEVEKVDMHQTLRASVQMALHTNPKCTVVLLTDMATEMPDQGERCKVVRLPLRSDHLMRTRMACYHALTASGAICGPALYLDTDVCLNRDFSPVLSQPFDVGLTFRLVPSFMHMPVNEGVILTTSAAAGTKFFGMCRWIYEYLRTAPPVLARYDFDVGIWRGGQLSLAAFCNWDVPAIPETRAIRGMACRFLECDLYNFTPDRPARQHEWQDKWAIHFKGNRKAWMSSYVASATGASRSL